MRRIFVVAALVAVLGSVPLFGQMRGGHVGASFGRGFSSHSFGFAGGGVHRGGFGTFRGSGFFPGRRPFFRSGRPFFFGGSPFWFGGSFYWGPDYAPYYYGYPYSTIVVDPPPPANSYDYSDESFARSDLHRDLDRLNDKVDRLQRDVEARNNVPWPPVKQEAVRQSTVLVFKDKRREEVQNYAIVGRTLWVLDENKASKIALDDLDLDATASVNDDRGIDFQAPRN